MNALEQAMIAYGYVKCPNISQRWYAGGPGVPECEYDVFVRENYIEILPKWYQASRPVAIATFFWMKDFDAWLRKNGKYSESGFRYYGIFQD